MSELSTEIERNARNIEHEISVTVRDRRQVRVAEEIEISKTRFNDFMNGTGGLNLGEVSKLIATIDRKLYHIDQKVLSKTCIEVPASVVIQTYLIMLDLLPADDPQLREFQLKLTRVGLLKRINGDFMIDPRGYVNG